MLDLCNGAYYSIHRLKTQLFVQEFFPHLFLLVIGPESRFYYNGQASRRGENNSSLFRNIMSKLVSFYPVYVGLTYLKPNQKSF